MFKSFWDQFIASALLCSMLMATACSQSKRDVPDGMTVAKVIMTQIVLDTQKLTDVDQSLIPKDQRIGVSRLDTRHRRQLSDLAREEYRTVAFVKQSTSGDAMSMTTTYPDFPAATPHNKEYQDNYVNISLRFERRDSDKYMATLSVTLASVDQSSESALTANLGQVRANVASGDTLLVSLGQLSELDKRIPSDRNRVAIQHQTDPSFEPHAPAPEGVDLLNDDRSELSLTLQIRIDLVDGS